MMQSCASPAKLRSSGPILHSGLVSHGLLSGHRHLGFIGRPWYGLPNRLPCYSSLSVLLLTAPDVGQRPAELGRS
jgi:hypothetical protein